MLILSVILTLFVILELQRVKDLWAQAPRKTHEGSAPILRPEFLEESSYQIGNRLIHLFCFFMVLCSYYSFGTTGLVIGVLPILAVTASLDAFWIRVCLRQTPAFVPPRRRARPAVSEEVTQA